MSRQIKDPISGSWVNIAGYNAIDNALDPNSRNPVENRVIYEALADLVPKKIETGTISSLPVTVNDSRIKAGMEIIQYYPSNKNAVISIPDTGISISNGSITLKGTISGSTNIVMFLQKVS